MEKTVVAVADNGGRNRHGYPQGYRFVPKGPELIRLLEDKIAGRPLPYPLLNIFHDLRILDFHPDELHEAYKAYKEGGSLYFFSRREFPTPRSSDRARPVRVTNDGGNWKASGGGKPVTDMNHGGVEVGYELTMVFYEKKRKSPADTGKTDWGMHEFTLSTGPHKKVADLALYRLYKKKNKEAGEDDDTLSDGTPKLEDLPSLDPTAGGMSTASTSQARAQARVWQPHGYYHQDAFGAAASAPGPSSWETPTAANQLGQVHAGFMGLTGSPPGPLMALLMAPSPWATTVNCSPTSPKQQALSPQATATTMSPQQQTVNHMDLADWDNALTLPLPLAPSTASEPAAVAHDLPTSPQHPELADSNEQPLKILQPSPVPAPAAGDYLDDEFQVWCEKQQEQTAASPCWFPTPDDDDLSMLMDEENCGCTMEELLADMPDDADIWIEEPDTEGQVNSSKSNQ